MPTSGIYAPPGKTRSGKFKLVLSDVNWRYVGIPEGRGFSPAVSAPHPADGKQCFPGTPLPQKGERTVRIGRTLPSPLWGRGAGGGGGEQRQG